MIDHFILKCDHPQVSAFEFRDLRPEPVPIAFLRLGPERIFEYARAPFLLQIRALAQDLFFEVLGEVVLGHVRQDTASIRAGTCCRLTLSEAARPSLPRPLERQVMVLCVCIRHLCTALA